MYIQLTLKRTHLALTVKKDKYEELHAKVRMIFFENKQCYGYRRILWGFVTQGYHGFRESDSEDHAREGSCRVQ